MKKTLIVLGITQLFGWGTLYYSFSLFVTPIHLDVGWSYSKINSAATVSLICWALLAPLVGKLLHSKGAKFVMSLGSALATGGLFLWAIYPNNFPVFLFSWMLIGVSMSMVLYESAFAVITTRFETSYKKGISLLTIIGGLASTIFIPLIQFSIDSAGFENTIWLLAFLNGSVCFPLHFFCIPGSKLKKPKKR